MANMYTIHYPKSLTRFSALYGNILTNDIDTFNFTDLTGVESRDTLKDGGMWHMTINNSPARIYLDRESYIITPEGVKFEFSEFPHFAKYIANRNLERAIEVLE